MAELGFKPQTLSLSKAIALPTMHGVPYLHHRYIPTYSLLQCLVKNKTPFSQNSFLLTQDRSAWVQPLIFHNTLSNKSSQTGRGEGALLVAENWTASWVFCRWWGEVLSSSFSCLSPQVQCLGPSCLTSFFRIQSLFSPPHSKLKPKIISSGPLLL